MHSISSAITRRLSLQRLFGSLLTAALIVAGLIAVSASDASAASPLATDSGCNAHVLPRNDDSSTGLVSLPFRLNFYGRSYTTLYVNNNGNVTFQGRLGTYTPFTINANTPPIIAPFLADVDTRNTLSHQTTYGVTTYQGRLAFCVNWSRVGYFSGQVDKTNNFQLLLAQRNVEGDFDIVFNYGSIRWESGSASGGSGGLGGVAAGAGFSNGDGNANHFTQLPGSLTNGAFLDGNATTGLAAHSNTVPPVPGRYSYTIASGIQVAAANRCTPYYFVGLEGSGESTPYNNSRSASPKLSARNGFDPTKTLGIVLDAFAESYPAAANNVTVHRVPYRALGTETLGQGLSRTNFYPKFFDENLPTYIDSVFDGVNKTRAYVGKVRSDCAAQHIRPTFFFVGYSQGALAIHLFLRNQSASFAPYVGFVGLVADPAAVANRRELINWGTAADTDYGVCQKIKYVTTTDQCGTQTEDLPEAYHQVTESVCNTKDPVCSTSTVLTGPVWTWKDKFTADVAVHTRYAAEGSSLKNLGRSIASTNHLT